MKQIIAIGGGCFRGNVADFKIEKYCLAQIKKEHPNICFLPQASHEAENYILKFFDTFVKLGAIPSWISLFDRVQDSWKAHLLSQDIIYVGGGNTRSMLALWREWGMDKILIEAYHKGILLSGVSAGAICWFEQGITDSIWPLGIIDALGLINGSVCPHFDSENERQAVYRKHIHEQTIRPGFALEDGTALHFVEGALSCAIQFAPDKKIIRIESSGETLVKATLL